MPHDELDEKLQRLGRRVEARTADVRQRLADLGCLELADRLREAFGARLTYLGPPEGFPHGQPYNFDLKGHAHAAANPLDRPAKSAQDRPDNQPYRGKASLRKRSRRRPPAADRRSHPKPTWHDLQADR
jgi:hypothetical protein